MIRLEQVEYRAGDFHAVFDGQIARGCLLGILGPSGGGKSTLLSLIAGFAAPERGRIVIDGVDMTQVPPGQRPVTLLFQEHNLFPHLTAFENAGLGLSASLTLDEQARTQVEAALARVGLAGKGLQLPASLSGGERQRVAIARALLRDKPVLLLDEPFAGLGPGMRRDCLALVTELQRERGLTVVLVSHEPDDIKLAATHAAFISQGRMSPIVPVEGFFDEPLLASYL
jgi:thiamine transport system ATP-binding protein